MRLFRCKFSKVPHFNTYFPSLDQAEPDQKAYYQWMLREFKKGRVPDIQGNLSYLFVLIYNVINEFIVTRQYEDLARWFDFLRTGYA